MINISGRAMDWVLKIYKLQNRVLQTILPLKRYWLFTDKIIQNYNWTWKTNFTSSMTEDFLLLNFLVILRMCLTSICKISLQLWGRIFLLLKLCSENAIYHQTTFWNVCSHTCDHFLEVLQSSLSFERLFSANRA